MDRYTRPHSVVQTTHTAPYAMELLLTFNRSDHPMFAPLRFLKVEESPRLIVAFFTDFSHIHQLFHLITRSFSDTTVFLNIRSHVAYLLVEVDTKAKKNLSNTLNLCAPSLGMQSVQLQFAGSCGQGRSKKCRSTLERDRVASNVDFSLGSACATRVQTHARNATKLSTRTHAIKPKVKRTSLFCHATNLADPHQIRPTEWSQVEKRQIMSQSYSWNPGHVLLILQAAEQRRVAPARVPALPKVSMGRGGDVDLISMMRCFWQHTSCFWSLCYFFQRNELSTRPISRPQRGAKNCQRQEASCKHAESGPIHSTVIDKAP